ncbi:DUF192 domain-containing protein [Candidatus Woesearchaeota archaeon]|nr:DUF192 domain-containing protein [Candidatus Woesearchaeota archaeon]
MRLEDPIFCRDLISKGIGQMFRFKPAIMVFVFDEEQRVPLHMWFVFFPIDVVYLDSRHNIVELVENLKPFSYYNPKNKAKYVVEFSAGTIYSERLVVGNKIIFFE